MKSHERVHGQHERRDVHKGPIEISLQEWEKMGRDGRRETLFATYGVPYKIKIDDWRVHVIYSDRNG